MVEFISFGSGSSGNCYYFRKGDDSFVIDMGIGIRRFKNYCRMYGISLSKIQAVFLTHDHTDHSLAAGAFSQELGVPVYTSDLVHKGIVRNYHVRKKIKPEHTKVLEQGGSIRVGDFTITSFNVPHDSAQNNGYFISTSCGFNFCLCTDVGHVTTEMETFIQRAQYLVIEANYDLAMLLTGSYPGFLKTRIMGPNGHLCNDETAQALLNFASDYCKKVWLCHLSEENNRPQHALNAVMHAFRKAGREDFFQNCTLEALPRTEPTNFFSLAE